MRPALSSRPKMLQCPSLLCQLHPTQGRCVPQTSSPWKEPTTWYALSSIQRWSSSDVFHLARATLSHCSKKCFQSMSFPKYSALTLAFSMWICNSLSSALLGVSHMRPQALTTCNWMDLQRYVWNLWNMFSNTLSTVVLTHSSPFWLSKLYPSMPSSHHLQSSCTNATLGLPFLPEFTTPIWRPSRSLNELMPTLMPPSHWQRNDANRLHPCVPASLLWCMTPSIGPGSLPLWYMSCQKTATKYTPVMAWSTAIRDKTFLNAVSSLLTLPQMSHQPHQRLLPDLTFLQHCLHPPSLHNCCCPTCCTCNDHNSKTIDTSCPWSHPSACAYVCNTQHSPCAAL